MGSESLQGNSRPPESDPFLQVTGISKTFGRQAALRDVSFSVRAGEIVGLVGPNGAGKSTTLRIVCGLLTPDAGRVVLDGTDQRTSPALFRSMLGALIEAPALFPTLTAYAHMAYVARVRGCYNRGILEDLLASVGLPPRSSKAVRSFSLGMKQRLGIAMACLDAPRLLVLDEPMNGLDPLGMADLREHLRVLATRDQVTIVVSSHLLNEIEQVCARVLFIRDSRLISEVRLDGGASITSVVLVVATGSPLAALNLISAQAFVQEARLIREDVECVVPADLVPDVARVIVNAGIALYAMRPRRGGLEDLYLSQYRDSVERTIR
mgnify:CR=1 FL=1